MVYKTVSFGHFIYMTKIISAQELKKRLDQGNIILIDVREPAEYRSECIDGSCLIPLGTISTDKLPSTDKPIVIHCKSGKRSADACSKLLSTNPSLDIYSLEGGITAWQQAGYQIKTSGSSVLPLERQTHIVVGFIALTGTLLGTLIHPSYYILPGIIGTGLLFAGITGWCGMSILLSKMPWNK